MSRTVLRTENFAADAANLIRENALAAIQRSGVFRLALSGGNTPRDVYRQLAKLPVPWERVLFTFSDERSVPPDDKQSNFRMAEETLLRPAGVPSSSVLRMRGELLPADGAREYQEQLQDLAYQRGEDIYQHDLVLLGLGDDGHTASLFPGTSALAERNRLVAANYVPDLNSWRLTFTLPLIYAAAAVCFLVGANKDQHLLARVFAGDASLPAAQVDQNARQVTWLIACPKLRN